MALIACANNDPYDFYTNSTNGSSQASGAHSVSCAAGDIISVSHTGGPISNITGGDVIMKNTNSSGNYGICLIKATSTSITYTLADSGYSCVCGHYSN